MNRKYNLKLDLQFRCNNSIMKFNQFDNNTSDFFIKISNGGKSFDVEKAIVVLAIIKPSGKVASQFVEIENGLVYADLKPNMKDEIGTYTAKAMLILEDERVVTDVISYEVEEDKIFSLLNDSVEDTEDFTLLTDMLSRLSAIEISEEQRVINEAERILSEENRKIEEAKRVEAELIRQHEEADRAKYDATRESNENIRKQNESTRLANETNRIDEEAKRVEEETNRVKAEQLRKDNYNFMTEDEERRRLEANAHKEAENLRAQAENTRVNEEAKRRTTEQARVLAENTRVSNENTRKANEETRQNNETHRVEAETQRQNRYNSFIADAEVNANNFENYTNSAKVKEEERKSNELNRKSQEDRRVSNEVERISNENARKANEVAREKNETSRQNIFENKVDEVDKKIVEINTTKDNFVSNINTKVDTKISEIDNVKDNFVSSINTKVDTKISEIEVAKSDMTNTVSNKINEVETRFNALTSSQQQDAEVIDARDGETSLKARLDRDIEKAKQVYVNVEGSHISTDSNVGYLKDVEILGNTIQSASNLADIRSVGDKIEGQELYEIPVSSCGKNLFDGKFIDGKAINFTTGEYYDNTAMCASTNFISANGNSNYYLNVNPYGWVVEYDANKKCITGRQFWNTFRTSENCRYVKFYIGKDVKTDTIQLEEGTQSTPYEPYIEDKLTILSLVQLEKVGDVRDRIVCKDGVWGVEKNVITKLFDGSENNVTGVSLDGNGLNYRLCYSRKKVLDNVADSSKLMSNKFECFVYSSSTNNVTVPSFRFIYTNSELYCVVPATEFTEHPSTQAFKEKVASYGTYIKYPTTQPQFIPLPHDQQVKLRTFASKTNISFCCEIEGTIKAQVPKSIGATVNTHTEQINNLNKELDRVKKLEESTVSTVTTESDFTTVEATSNGYFEDVKLEGKTLVNLAPFNGVRTMTTEGKTSPNWIQDRIPLMSNLKPFTKYTVIFNVLKNTTTSSVTLRAGGVYSQFEYLSSFKVNPGETGTFICLSTSKTNFDDVIVGEMLQFGQTFNGVEEFAYSMIVLEGDHTQNPPSYFEGLKSVGDGVDEIVVSSVKGDGNLIDGEFYKLTEHIAGVNCSCLAKNTTYTINFDIDVAGGLIGLISDKSKPEKTDFLISNWGVVGNTITFTTPQSFIEKEYTIIFRKTDIHLNIEGKKAILNKGTTPKPYVLHQSDKKRLLYYNNETQTWEKPILREWDSIEKHSDGKYYYHVRSKEGDYVEGDESLNDCITDLTVSVKKLAEEKVYECTNIDLITYANETNYIVNCGAIVPKTTLKVHNNISNVVSLLQKKVSILESNITSYMITQNRLMLASRYNADTVSFKVDVATLRNSFEYDNDLYELILNNILVGKDNYNREYIENLIIFYWMDFVISDEMHSTLFEIIEEQHNPKVIEEETPLI